MSDPNTQQEPSMEEILASIRRIISEDGEEPAAPAKPAPPKAAAPAPRKAAPPPEPEPEPEPEPAPEDEDDILELTEEIEDDEAEINLIEEEVLPGAEDAEADDVELEMVELPDEVEEPEPEPQGQPAMAPVAALAAAVVAEERLVSQPPATASVSSLASLAAAVDNHRRAVDPSIGPKTIEDLVKEVMRPMIREWLDGNLPSLVERLVGREIQRLMREAEELSER